MTRARVLADYVSSGDELADKAPLASPAFTGTPTGIVSGSIADDAIDSQHYAAGSIDNEHLASSIVTSNKLYPTVNTDIATGVTANTTANAALPKAGGTMTGDLVPATPMSHRNMIINGGMSINQRGAGSLTINSGTLQYPCDRFAARGESSAGVFTIEKVTDSPAGFTNSLKATVTTADSSLTGTDSYRIVQHIEGNNISHLNWGSSDNQTVTLSFKVKSSLAGTFGGVVQNGDYNRFVPFTYEIDDVDTWEDKEVTIAGDTTGTYQINSSLAVRLNWSLGAAALGTADTYTGSALNGATGQTQVISTNGATWQITGVQLELGSNATPFEHRSYGEELIRCQRYYWVNDNNYGYVKSRESDRHRTANVPFPVTMRAQPTVTALTSPSGITSITWSANGDKSMRFNGYAPSDGYVDVCGTAKADAEL